MKLLFAAFVSSLLAVQGKTLVFQKNFLMKLGNNTVHYGNPSGGCMSDEQDVQVQGLTGDFCSPQCVGTVNPTCPTDVPANVTANPECVLEDESSKKKYCALVCSVHKTNQCGAATCQKIQLGLGLCTYSK